MKLYYSLVWKSLLLIVALLQASNSFSQYAPAENSDYASHPSNYYPHMHDSAVTVKPKLIKPNFIYYGFLSSLNQHISFEYNRQMSDDIMLCGQVGIINSGLSQITGSTSSAGGYFEGSMKLFFNPDYTRDGRHGWYAVEGIYIKPMISIVSFTNTITTTGVASYYVYPPATITNVNQYSYTGAALFLNVGGQWMIAHAITIDIYGGIGCSFSNAYSSNLPDVYNYFDYLSTGQNIPLAFTGGINIGLPF